MYVCICNAVSDREIRAEVAAGARSLSDIIEALGVAAVSAASPSPPEA